MEISYSQVEDTCNEMHVLAQNMKDILENVKQLGNRLNSTGSWVGEASSHYSTKLDKLVSNFDEIYKEIENSILYMAHSAEGYEAIDERVMSEICNNLNISEPNLSTSSIFS